MVWVRGRELDLTIRQILTSPFHPLPHGPSLAGWWGCPHINHLLSQSHQGTHFCLGVNQLIVGICTAPCMELCKPWHLPGCRCLQKAGVANRLVCGACGLPLVQPLICMLHSWCGCGLARAAWWTKWRGPVDWIRPASLIFPIIAVGW